MIKYNALSALYFTVTKDSFTVLRDSGSQNIILSDSSGGFPRVENRIAPASNVRITASIGVKTIQNFEGWGLFSKLSIR